MVRAHGGTKAHRRGLALVAMLLLAACGESSRVDPEATVTVSGEVRTSGGQPVEGRPVSLGTGVTVGDGAFGVLTLGLACTGGSCSGDFWDTTTGTDGRYSFTLQGQDTQSSFGEAESVLVSAQGAPDDDEVSGPVTTARFLVQATRVEVPTLELVDPDLEVRAQDGVEAQWAPVRPAPYELRFETDETTPVWQVATAEPRVVVDPRVLEDTAGRVVVSGTSEDAVEGSDVTLTWRSGGVGYVAGAGAPPSRGRGCAFVDAAGRQAAATDGCDLTDGDLDIDAVPPPVCDAGGADAACVAATAAVIDLGQPVPAELVVVRGCEGGCPVEVSADGEQYRPAGTAPEGFGTLPLGGEPVRSVRVGLGDGATGLREVSVWGPATGDPLRPVDDGRRSDLAAPYAGAEEDGDVPVLLAGVAAAAVLAVAVAAAFLLGRRRARRS